MTLNFSRNTEQFAVCLTEFVKEMEQSLATKYDNEMDIKERLRSLPFKPQDKLFTSLFGCGRFVPSVKHPVKQEERSIQNTSPPFIVHKELVVGGIQRQSVSD
ncbi:hypothetical protein DPEC_G00181840 [Dallia pectoralis]|uniref:Uncharacterized protein n=1 Tax=Dallia pectoralis TaxID=75939 RepID=A0ACC2GAS0_DALPE|nr:hypothetical protein DPEC_G00181840 [Dallia pectoralis]